MTEKIVYVSNDGMEFDDADSCQQYEEKETLVDYLVEHEYGLRLSRLEIQCVVELLQKEHTITKKTNIV